ncbi:MAG TPA: peptidylprolyl isomerase [Alphaproteobacteria bacterium]|jgi:peptidyl-prolyl cis-trans isomerase C|nr:peptidylprolyl isomerase [Alphaproteobacteria bacterium]
MSRAAGTASFSLLLVATLTLSAASIPSAAAQTAPKAAPTAPVADPVVGRVNGEAVLRSDVLREAETLPPQFQQMPIEALWPVLLDRVIDRKLIAGAARKDGLANDADVKARMKDLEDRVLEQTFLVKRMQKQVTEAAMQKRYAEMIGAMKPEARVHARHILVKTRDEAVDIIRELAKGTDFAKLAGERSQDPSSAKAGGDLGWISKEQVVGPFGDAVFAMKKGETSRAPVQTQFGFHVIRVDDIQADYKPSYDEKRDEIQQALSEDVEGAERSRLRNGAKIERLTPDGSKPLPPTGAPALPPGPGTQGR